MKKILIQTALSLEFDAVKSFLNEIQVVRHPSTGSIYNRGLYNGNEVLIVETGAGNVRSADETSRAIDFFKPDYVFFVGVAGGLKDVKIGDVVASSKVIGFEMGKDDTEFKPRLDTIPSSYVLEQVAKHVKREGNWKQLIQVENNIEPEVFVQPIAAGEKVVSSNKSVAFDYLKKYCSDAVAVDMEGNGFLIAARPHHSHAIEVRGISDLIENKSEADAGGSQPRAAANAAAFCFEMINQIETDSTKLPDTNSLEFRKGLVNELVNLYPQGPEQDDIWKRAGGDISIIVNSANRRSQWFNLIEKLYFGGGGKGISVTSLMNEIKEDYPNFISEAFEKTISMEGTSTITKDENINTGNIIDKEEKIIKMIQNKLIIGLYKMPDHSYVTSRPDYKRKFNFDALEMDYLAKAANELGDLDILEGNENYTKLTKSGIFRAKELLGEI